MNYFDFGMSCQHILEGIIRGNAEFFSSRVSLCLVDVADSNKFSQRIVLDAVAVGIADTAHAYYTGLKDFFHGVGCPFLYFFVFRFWGFCYLSVHGRGIFHEFFVGGFMSVHGREFFTKPS